MRSALTAKLQDNELLILDAFDMDEIKTKVFVQAMNGLELDSALVIVDEPNEVLEKSARNAGRLQGPSGGRPELLRRPQVPAPDPFAVQPAENRREVAEMREAP